MKARSVLRFLFLITFESIHALADTRYVDPGSVGPTPPYTNWGTAAVTIQDAIDAAVDGDLILVTNGVYATGGRAEFGSLTNRVTVNKAVTVQSVNGPELTAIEGYQVPGVTHSNQAVRGVYLVSGARLQGFTVRSGATLRTFAKDGQGGGIRCESTNAVVSNCVIVANASYSGGAGGYGGAFQSCRFTENTNLWGGGGGAALGVLSD